MSDGKISLLEAADRLANETDLQDSGQALELVCLFARESAIDLQARSGYPKLAPALEMANQGLQGKKLAKGYLVDYDELKRMIKREQEWLPNYVPVPTLLERVWRRQEPPGDKDIIANALAREIEEENVEQLRHVDPSVRERKPIKRQTARTRLLNTGVNQYKEEKGRYPSYIELFGYLLKGKVNSELIRKIDERKREITLADGTILTAEKVRRCYQRTLFPSEDINDQ